MGDDIGNLADTSSMSSPPFDIYLSKIKITTCKEQGKTTIKTYVLYAWQTLHKQKGVFYEDPHPARTTVMLAVIPKSGSSGAPAPADQLIRD